MKLVYFLIIFFFLFSSVAVSAQDLEQRDVVKRLEEANDQEKLKRETVVENSDQVQPIYVKSKKLFVDAKKQLFVYEGNVEVLRGDLVITSSKMIGQYDADGKLTEISCQDNVVITRGEGLRASSDRAIYFVANDTIELTEGPELYHNGNALTADKVTVYVKEDRSEADGNVKVKVIKPSNATS